MSDHIRKDKIRSEIIKEKVGIAKVDRNKFAMTWACTKKTYEL